MHGAYMVHTMKEMLLHLPDQDYERLIAEATAAHKSPEQWILDRLFPESPPSLAAAEPHLLLTAALDMLGFQRLAPDKARRLSELLTLRKAHPLSNAETDELQALMTEANTLELGSLQHLAAVFQR